MTTKVKMVVRTQATVTLFSHELRMIMLIVYTRMMPLEDGEREDEGRAQKRRKRESTNRSATRNLLRAKL